MAIDIVIPIKRRGFINQGSTLALLPDPHIRISLRDPEERAGDLNYPERETDRATPKRRRVVIRSCNGLSTQLHMVGCQN